ncbi:MAG: hypothetical protein R3F34_15290 [Planctomycetota bacterium]
MAPEDRPTDADRPADDQLAGAHAQLETALSLALGGFRLLDQGLELTDGGFVHLLGADGAGRLVLVLLVSEADEETVSRSLEALELAVDHAAVVHHHLTGGHASASGLDPRKAPRLLLVGEEFPLGRVRRLTTFCRRQSQVELYELRVLRSSIGETLYLYRIAGQATAPQGGGTTDRPTGAGESRPKLELIDHLGQRLRGLDPSLEPRAVKGGRVWTFRGEDFVEARPEPDGSLAVRIADQSEITLRNTRELDLFLEKVVAEYLKRMGGA